MKWFRFHNEALDDPKVQQLPADLFKAWVNILCIASKNGGVLPAWDKVVFALRVDGRKAERWVNGLVSAGLLDKEPNEPLRPHNWNARQYASDDSGNRVKALRERRRNADVTVTVTPPEADTETDKKKDIKNLVGSAVKAVTSGGGVADWTPEAKRERWLQKLLPVITHRVGAEHALQTLEAFKRGDPLAKRVVEDADKDYRQQSRRA